MPAILTGESGRIGGEETANVPKLRTAIAWSASITPTEAPTRASAGAFRRGR